MSIPTVPHTARPETRRRYILDAARGDPALLAKSRDRTALEARLAVIRAELRAKDAEERETRERRKEQPKKQSAERSLLILRGCLDGLADVGMACKACAKSHEADEKVAARCRVMVRAALQARSDARRALEAVLLGDSVDAREYEMTLKALKKRLETLPVVAGAYDVAAARAESHARDSACAAYLGDLDGVEASKMAALRSAMVRHQDIERSWAFQRALFFEQLRFSAGKGKSDDAKPVHDRASLSFGTTPFVSWCDVMNADVLAGARTACKDGKGYVVLGASTGTLCFYAAALGFAKVTGVEVLPTLVTVARGIAQQHEDLGLGDDDFVCADVRDVKTLRPILADAAVVILTSSCWDIDVVDGASAALDDALPEGAFVVDYAPNFEDHPAFAKVGAVAVPVSWCLNGDIPVTIYRKKSDADAELAWAKKHEEADALREAEKAASPPPASPPRGAAAADALPSPSRFAVERPIPDSPAPRGPPSPASATTDESAEDPAPIIVGPEQ